MQLRNAPKLLLAVVFVVAALAVGSDAGETDHGERLCSGFGLRIHQGPGETY